MALTLDMVTVDTTDAAALASWWAEQVSGAVVERTEGWCVVAGDALPMRLVFQEVDDPTPGKNRLHLDFETQDMDAEVDRLVAAGASVVARRTNEGFRWVTLADPQGNVFCVAQA